MKKFTAVLLALMMILPGLLFSVNAATMPVSDKLFAYYSFNEAVDGMIVDGMGKNHGALMRGAVIGSDADRGSVLSLDGKTAYVHLADDLMKTLSGDVTITAWYKWTDPDWRNWSRVYDLGTNTQNYYMMTPQSGDGTIRFEAKVTDQNVIVNGGDAETGKWIHTALTVSGTDVKFYINGELMEEGTYDYKPSEMGSTIGNFIGKSQYADPYFEGFIDDMAIYSAALTVDQVKEVMNTKFETPDSAKSTVVAAAKNPVMNTKANAEGMYAHYTFNEITDGKAIDRINGNNAKIFNGATIANDPVRGNVLALDGVNQYVLLPDNSTKDVNAFTVSLWYKWTDPDDRHWSRVLDLGSDTDDYIFVCPRDGEGNLRLEIKSRAWGNVDRLDGPSAIADEWVHVAAVLANGNATFYVNGELVEEYGVDMKASDLGDSIQNFIGRSQFAADAYFMGYVDDLVLYNKGLSSAEVVKLMNTDFKNAQAEVQAPAEKAPEEKVTDATEAPAEAQTEAPAETPAEDNKPAQAPAEAPKTGDNTAILIIMLCAAVAIAGVVVVRVKKSRER